jgi:hypothetical protein
LRPVKRSASEGACSFVGRQNSSLPQQVGSHSDQCCHFLSLAGTESHRRTNPLLDHRTRKKIAIQRNFLRGKTDNRDGQIGALRRAPSAERGRLITTDHNRCQGRSSRELCSPSTSAAESHCVHKHSDAPIPGSPLVVREPARTARRARTKSFSHGENTG